MALNDSFEALKSMIADVAMAASRVTKSAAAVTKANINILSEEDKLKKAYLELGKLYYRDYITCEEPDDAEYIPLCDAITEATKNIDELRAAVKEIRFSKPAEEDDQKETEEEPAEAAESQVAEELDSLNKELDQLEKGLEDLNPADTVQDAVFEVVEEKPEDPKPEE